MEKQIKKVTRKETAFQREKRVCEELSNILKANQTITSLTDEQRDVLIKADAKYYRKKQILVPIIRKSNYEEFVKNLQAPIQSARNYERDNNLSHDVKYAIDGGYGGYYGGTTRKICVSGYISPPDSTLIKEYIDDWKMDQEAIKKKEEKRIQLRLQKDAEKARLRAALESKRQKESKISKADILAEIKRLTVKLEKANIK
jgi:hypothetical protein